MALNQGQYHPRIGRGPWRYQVSPYAVELKSLYRQLILLNEDLEEIFNFVQPDVTHKETYGHKIRNLLLLAATEFEAQCVGILKANGVAPIGRHYNTNDFVKLKQVMILDQYKLKLNSFPNYPNIVPFSDWDANAPTESLIWFAAYNKTKHDRETQFAAASLENAIKAVAAIMTIFVAQVIATDCNAPSLRLPSTFSFLAWPETYPEPRYIQPRGDNEWESVPYPF